MPRLQTLKPKLATLSAGRIKPLQSAPADSWRAGKQGSAARGYGYAWQKARDGHLRNQPLCVMCEAQGRATPATVVDHRIPHKGDMKLFWQTDNWQSLCKPHHDSKTAAEDGGFGRQGKTRR